MNRSFLENDKIALAQWQGATENLSQRHFNASRCSTNTLKRMEIEIYSLFLIFCLHFMMSTFAYFLHSWFVWEKIELYLTESQITVNCLLQSFCVHILEQCEKFFIFSPLVLIIVNQSVKKDDKLKSFIPCHRVVFVQATGGPEKVFSEISTKLTNFCYAALTSKFN